MGRFITISAVRGKMCGAGVDSLQATAQLFTQRNWLWER
jgi:hypothetical protein